MAHVNGCSSLVSGVGIELAHKILSKFALKPYQRMAEEKSIYLFALVGPCPCDTCHINPECATTGHQCKAFRHFVSTGRWLASEVATKLR